jgi:hypothetical protein
LVSGPDGVPGKFGDISEIPFRYGEGVGMTVASEAAERLIAAYNAKDFDEMARMIAPISILRILIGILC